MSGLDPLAALALQAVANAQAAIDESTLDLGSLTAEFQSKLSVGDIISATVLPPQNGTDRLSLLGQTIAAQLPPGIDPGETIALVVTGFSNTSIFVRNLGPVDALPETQPKETPVSDQPVSTPSAPAAPSSAPVAPPRELFVAASVRPTPTNAAPLPAEKLPVQNEPSAPAPRTDLEARIAASRAGTIGLPNVKAPTAQPSPPAGPAAPSLRATVPPQLQPPIAAARASAPPAAQSALLARLRIPVTPTTFAASTIVDTATRNLTTAYEKLDALLTRLPQDARIAPLRTLLPFLAKLDLRNVRALPEQIAAYVSNVVSGPEAKIAQIVRAWTEAFAQQEVTSQTAPPQAPGEPQTPVEAQTLAALPREGVPEPQIHAGALPVLAARTAERTVALEHDVKTALLQLVAEPPQSAPAQVVAALRDALTATTAVQINAMAAQNSDPNTIAIPLPAYFYDGGAPAQLRISRDAPGAKRAFDADNFRIAFVLDTKTLGTVAIDVATAGRAVSIDVKTESARSADRFRASLGDLRTRLEGLRYRVAAMAAARSGRVSTPRPEAHAKAVRTSNWDARA